MPRSCKGDSDVPAESGLLPFGTTGWWVWEHFALRSAGFPMRDLTERLASDTDDDVEPQESLRRALELAHDDRVTMALLWQNPSIIDNVVNPLTKWLRDVESGTATNSKKTRQRLRRRERTLARYLQRYYTRNETIGFFGPITWGRFADQDPLILMKPREPLTDQQIVSFEDWAIHRLGTEFARDPAIRWNLSPALSAGVKRSGRVVLLPDAVPQRLTEAEANVLDLVDGQRSAAVIAAEVGDEQGTAAILDSLVERGIVCWGFTIPVDLHTEDDLLRQLDELPDLPAVRRARDIMAELIVARDQAAAATTPAELAAALDMVEHRYTACTRDVPRRTADAAERGRGLLVAQSHRAVDVVVSTTMLAELARPLSLILTSARWFCWQVGELAVKRLREAHSALSAMYGSADVPLDVLLGALSDFLRDDSAIAAIRDELARRWTAVLRLDQDARVSTFTTAEIAHAVARSFESPMPDWYVGRHHSPDVMIAASDVSAIHRGDYQFVLGEVHAGSITCDSGTLNSFAPAPDAILRPAEAALDSGLERYVPLYHRGMAGVTGRYYPSPETFSERYHYLSFGARESERRTPAGRRVELASIKAIDGPGGLEVCFPDGTRKPLLVVVGEFLSQVTTSTFPLVPAWTHTPRVVIDRLVIARETWRIPASEFATAPNDSDLVERIRNVARRYGLARHCFWRARPDQKPVYLDFRSPILVRLLASCVRNVDDSLRICFTEMLPGPDQLWLTDAKGRRYTSELRMVVLERSCHA